MLRDCDLNEISDGRKYMINDMVKADCNGCKNCSECCCGMENTIVLDPLDFYRLSNHLKLSFEAMLDNQIELNIVDGIILPNIKMNNNSDKQCVFLDGNKRCSVHIYRPGICRMFPLGRLYEDKSFFYILQINECPYENKSKVKVSKWIDTPNLKQNQRFISDWHYFLKEMHIKLLEHNDETLIRKITMQLLQFFYIESYNPDEDFYSQFYTRFEHIKKIYINI